MWSPCRASARRFEQCRSDSEGRLSLPDGGSDAKLCRAGEMPPTRGARLEVQRFRCKKFFDAKLPGNDLLIYGELDESLDCLPVRPISITDPKWKRISDNLLERDGRFICRRKILARI